MGFPKMFSHELSRDARVRPAFPVPEIRVEFRYVRSIWEAATLFEDLEHLVDLFFREGLVELRVVRLSARL